MLTWNSFLLLLFSLLILFQRVKSTSFISMKKIYIEQVGVKWAKTPSPYLNLVGKLNFWLLQGIFSTKAEVEVLAHILNTYIQDNVFSNDKSERLKLKEHLAFDIVLKTFEIRNLPIYLKRVETFRHNLDGIHQLTFLLVRINEARIFMPICISCWSLPISVPYRLVSSHK